MEKSSGERISDSVDESIRTRLEIVEEFSTITSTNSYLLQQPVPMPGNARVVVANEQTGGRGQRGKVWHSPPLAGLYLSVSYTFARAPENFSCLTLAAGIAVTAALEGFGATGIKLKWPNDLILLDGKLGGILTEALAGESGSPTVVVGLGLNLDMAGQLDDVADKIGRISDLRQTLPELPDRSTIAAAIVEQLIRTLQRFELDGFAPFHAQWQQKDWLDGKTVLVATPSAEICGTASGLGDDGALLVQSGSSTERIVSGTVTLLTQDALSRQTTLINPTAPNRGAAQ